MKSQIMLFGPQTKPARCQGSTLIELMISLTIGLMIIAGIGYAYLGTRQNFRTLDALSRMQEGARTAFDFMSKDIRMAGFRGCPPNDDASGDFNALTNPTNWWKNLLGQPLIGYEKTGGDWSAFPAGVTGVVGDVINGDAITVLHANMSESYIIQSHVPGDAKFTLTSTPDPIINPGTILIAAKNDCSRIAIFQNTDDDNDDNIVIHGNDDNDTVDLGSSGPDTFPANSRLYPLSAATYYIRTNAYGEPSLYRETLTSTGSTIAEELVEGVEDMQLLYGEDIAGSIDKIDEYRTANNVADWSRIIGVRVSLLMVSRQDEQGITTEPQTYALDKNGDGDVTDDGETITPDDRLLRKVFTTTIAVRNRL